MKLPYIPALDGVRTLAVGLVLLLHWPFPMLQMPFGWAGVNIFFVLSGFLITRILINARTEPIGFYLRSFYRNRLLRIFPLYYAYLLVIGIVLTGLAYLATEAGPPEVIANGLTVLKNEWLLLLTYTYNFNDLLPGITAGVPVAASPFFSHLWSLAIEEQYYLLFPFLVYYLPRKALLIFLAAIVFLTPPLRLLVGELNREPGQEHFIGLILSKVTIFHLDGFATGGLLAMLPLTQFRKPGRWLFLSAMILLVTGLLITNYLRQNGIEIGRKSLGLDHPLYQYSQQPDLWFLRFRYAFTYTIVNLVAALLLITALNVNRTSSFLKWKPMVFAGRLTYGIYILHFPILAFSILVLEKFRLEEQIRKQPLLEILAFGVYLAMVIGIAWLSFRFFESYFLRLKHQPLIQNGMVSAKKTSS